MITALQLVHLFPVMDLYTPTCLREVLMNIGLVVNAEINALTDGLNPVANNGVSTRFDNMGWPSTAFWVNSLDIFVVALLAVLLVIPITRVRRPNAGHQLFRYLAQTYRGYLATTLVPLVFTKIVFNCIVNFSRIDWDEGYGIKRASLIFACFFFVGFTSYMLLHFAFALDIVLRFWPLGPCCARLCARICKRCTLCRFFRRPHPGAPSLEDYGRFFNDEIEMRSPLAVFYPFLFFLRRFLYVLLLVTLHHNDFLMVFLFKLLNAFALVILILLRPLRDPLCFWIALYHELALCVISFTVTTEPVKISFAQLQIALLFLLIFGGWFIATAYHLWFYYKRRIGDYVPAPVDEIKAAPILDPVEDEPE